MLRPLGTVAVAATVWAAALTLPATVQAKDGAVNTTAVASSSVAAARAEYAAPRIKRARKSGTQPMRRVAAVAAPAPHHSRCALFWCTAGGRTFSTLMLGVAY
jgi:hypothetical protein